MKNTKILKPMAIEKTVLKLFEYPVGPQSTNPGIFYLPQGMKLENYTDSVILHKDIYKEIFGKTKSTSDIESKLLSVVKITFNGKSIHRRFCTISSMKKGYAALSCDSLLMLDSNISAIKNVQFSKGSKFCYYWNHPFHATRISMRIGTISIAMAIFSILITLL